MTTWLILCWSHVSAALTHRGMDFTRPPEGALWYLEPPVSHRGSTGPRSLELFLLRGRVYLVSNHSRLPARTENPGWIVMETIQQDRRAVAGQLNKAPLFIVLFYQKASLVSWKRCVSRSEMWLFQMPLPTAQQIIYRTCKIQKWVGGKVQTSDKYQRRFWCVIKVRRLRLAVWFRTDCCFRTANEIPCGGIWKNRSRRLTALGLVHSPGTEWPIIVINGGLIKAPLLNHQQHCSIVRRYVSF